jgi:hypothetical protein
VLHGLCECVIFFPVIFTVCLTPSLSLH